MGTCQTPMAFQCVVAAIPDSCEFCAYNLLGMSDARRNLVNFMYAEQGPYYQTRNEAYAAVFLRLYINVGIVLLCVYKLFYCQDKTPQQPAV